MTNKTKPAKKPTLASDLPAMCIRAEPHEIELIRTAARAARQSITQYAVGALVAAAKKTLEKS